MYNAERLNQTTWDCKYHPFWIPKYRRKLLYGHLRKYLGEVLRDLSLQKKSRVVEGHIMPDHVYMLLSIPPKYSLAQVVGYIKGKSAMHITGTFSGHEKNFTGHHFWATGQYVSTVGKEEKAVRDCIKIQEAEDLRLDQFYLFR